MKPLIGAKQLQKFLQIRGFYKGRIDGIFGRKSQHATKLAVTDYIETNRMTLRTDGWKAARWQNAAVQILFKDLGLYSGNVDGLDGPNTQYALEQYQNLMRDTDDDDDGGTVPTRWPLYSQMEQFYGPVGTSQKRFDLPYPMVLAWDTDTEVSRITMHEKCGPSAIGVLEEVRDHYGLPAIKELYLDMFGGSLNVRKMRGGNRYSTHSWGCSIDFDPERNQFRWTDSRASLAAREYEFFWKAWERQGWVSLGRERNFDWMHVQAVRL
jgi:hypothetical protein